MKSKNAITGEIEDKPVTSFGELVDGFIDRLKQGYGENWRDVQCHGAVLCTTSVDKDALLSSSLTMDGAAPTALAFGMLHLKGQVREDFLEEFDLHLEAAEMMQEGGLTEVFNFGGRGTAQA